MLSALLLYSSSVEISKMAQMPIPDDWDGQATKCYVIEWPDSVLYQAILMGLISTPTRGRFWDGKTGTITVAQAVGRQFYQTFLDLNNPGGTMGCFEQINATLQCICQALQAGIKVGGANGAGNFAATPEDFIDDGSSFPDGFASRTEYDVAKCNLSQLVINNLVNSFDAMKAIDASATSAEALAIVLSLVLLVATPFSVIIALASAILALAAIGLSVYVTACEELASRVGAIDICELYEAQTVGEAISNVQDWIAGGTYSQQSLTVTLGQYLITTNLINPLFAPKNDAINYPELPEGDCSGCSTSNDLIYFDVYCGIIIGELLSGSVQGPTARLGSTQGNWGCNPGAPFYGVFIAAANGVSFHLDSIAQTGIDNPIYWGTLGDGTPIAYYQTGLPPTDVDYRVLNIRDLDYSNGWYVDVGISAS